jgi:hypothetical protein
MPLGETWAVAEPHETASAANTAKAAKTVKIGARQRLRMTNPFPAEPH